MHTLKIAPTTPVTLATTPVIAALTGTAKAIALKTTTQQ